MSAHRVLLISCYEQGHRPLSLAWPAALLRPAGFEVIMRDLSQDYLRAADTRGAILALISAPMHTATRLAVHVARRLRASAPALPIGFFGLYAWHNREYLFAANGGAPLADFVLSGEIEQTVVELARATAAGLPPTAVPGISGPDQPAAPVLTRLNLPAPDAGGLPPLTAYSHFMHYGRALPAGYVEASRGCLHTCAHCPITPVYGGRFFVTPMQTILADIRRQVEEGAAHISFGDPDFLNGPGHSIRLLRAMHAEFPSLTFDFTTKVEHILLHRRLFPELVELCAAFVISAFESTADHVLQRLQKGHTAANLDEALGILDKAGLPVQPTWVPFTPWTTLDDFLAMLAWIRRHRLESHIPPVQLSIRLLVSPGSALLDQPDAAEWRGELQPENFTYAWRHSDPRMDRLQELVAQEAERLSDNPLAAYRAIEQAAYGLAGRLVLGDSHARVLRPTPPRLTEDWFC